MSAFQGSPEDIHLDGGGGTGCDVDARSCGARVKPPSLAHAWPMRRRSRPEPLSGLRCGVSRTVCGERSGARADDARRCDRGALCRLLAAPRGVRPRWPRALDRRPRARCCLCRAFRDAWAERTLDWVGRGDLHHSGPPSRGADARRAGLGAARADSGWRTAFALRGEPALSRTRRPVVPERTFSPLPSGPGRF
jgi:hypothetical protein